MSEYHPHKDPDRWRLYVLAGLILGLVLMLQRACYVMGGRIR